MEIKTKVNRWDLIKLNLRKLKFPSHSKGVRSKVKRQPSEWEKIIVNEATDKGLIFKIYKLFMSLVSEK